MVEVVTIRAQPPSSPLTEPAPVLEPVVRYPSDRIAYDRARADRLYAGGSVSEDGGRTWRTLVGDGVSVRLLGGMQALPPVPGPSGRLLVGGVLFEEPGITLGLGGIARAAEWRDGRWTQLGSATPESDLVDAWSDRRARAIGYTPDGTAVIVTAREVATFDGRSWPTPGQLRSALVSSTGAIYAGIGESGRFALYRADSLGAPWMPVAGVESVDALTETAGVVLILSGTRVGRLEQGQWTWNDLPASVRPRQLAAHPDQPLVAAWSGDGLLISVDGGRQLRTAPLELEVRWAAWDPFAADTLIVVGRGGRARRLSLQSLQ